MLLLALGSQKCHNDLMLMATAGIHQHFTSRYMSIAGAATLLVNLILLLWVLVGGTRAAGCTPVCALFMIDHPAKIDTSSYTESHSIESIC